MKWIGLLCGYIVVSLPKGISAYANCQPNGWIGTKLKCTDVLHARGNNSYHSD